MTVAIYGGQLKGEVNVPSSKSQLHRLIICAALAGGAEIKISGEISEDIAATIDCIEALGGSFNFEGDTIKIGKIRMLRNNVRLRCRESGSTLRFLLPIIGALGNDAFFEIDESLSKRPHQEIINILKANGCIIEETKSIISVSGKLSANRFVVRGDISSQYISGLIMALPLIGGGEIIVTDGLVSSEYVRLTMDVLHHFGCFAEFESERKICVSGRYIDKSIVITADSDNSLAAFWRAANKLGSDINIKEKGKFFILSESDKIDGSQIPDYIPILALIASSEKGKTTEFTNCGRLRFKESDRIKSTVNLINDLGGKATETTDGFIIEGTSSLIGGIVNAENDHRIVMTAVISAAICDNPVIINGSEAVKKSYPSFFKDFILLGGRMKEVENVIGFRIKD